MHHALPFQRSLLSSRSGLMRVRNKYGDKREKKKKPELILICIQGLRKTWIMWVFLSFFFPLYQRLGLLFPLGTQEKECRNIDDGSLPFYLEFFVYSLLGNPIHFTHQFSRRIGLSICIHPIRLWLHAILDPLVTLYFEHHLLWAAVITVYDLRN